MVRWYKLRKIIIPLLLISVPISTCMIVVSCSSKKTSKPNNNPSNTPTLDVSKIPDEFIAKNISKLDVSFYKDKLSNLTSHIKSLILSNADNNVVAEEFSQLIISLSQFTALSNDRYIQYDISTLNLTRDHINKLIIIMQSRFGHTMITIDWFKNISFNFDANNIAKEIKIEKNELINYYSRQYQIQLSKVCYEAYLTLRNGMSDVDKILVIATYITKYFNYSLSQNGNFYSAIMTRQGVCRDYSTLTSLLLSSLGIENYVEYGYSIGTEFQTNGYHVWNMVKVNNEWVVLDVTSSDSNYINVKPINSTGSSIYYNIGFLIGKNDNNNFSTINSTIQANPLFYNQNLIDESLGINKYIHTNSPFIYNDYFSKSSYNTLLRDTKKSNTIPLCYFNGNWYTFIKSNNKYNFVQYNLNTNVQKVLFTLNNVFFEEEVILYGNTFFIPIIDSKNQTKYLASLTINTDNYTQMSLNKIIDLEYDKSYKTMYFENDKLMYENQILINDLSVVVGFSKQTNIDSEYEKSFFNLLAKIWQYTTTIGDNYGQVSNQDYDSFMATNISNLKEFEDLILNKIKWKSPFFSVRRNIPSEIKINPDYFINIIQNIFGYLRFNFEVDINDSEYYQSPIELEYRWYHNNSLKNSSTSSGLYSFGKLDSTSIDNVYGEWYCEVVNKLNNEVIKSNVMKIIKTNDVYYDFYPYCTFLDNSGNTTNESLSIKIKNLKQLPNTTTYYDIILNDQKIIDNKLIDLSIASDTRILYEKDFNKLTANDFGNYVVEIRYKSNNNTTTWTSENYKFKYYPKNY